MAKSKKSKQVSGAVRKIVDDLQRIAREMDPAIASSANEKAQSLTDLHETYNALFRQVETTAELMLRDLDKLANIGYDRERLISVRAYVNNARAAFRDAIRQGGIEATLLQLGDAARLHVDIQIDGPKK